LVNEAISTSFGKLNDNGFCEKIELMEEKLKKPGSIKILQWAHWVVLLFTLISIFIYGYSAWSLMKDQCWDIYPGIGVGAVDAFCFINPKDVLKIISIFFVLLLIGEVISIRLISRRLKKL